MKSLPWFRFYLRLSFCFPFWYYRFLTHAWASGFVSQALWTHRCNIHTNLWTHTHSHTRVHIWPTLQRSWWIHCCLVSCVILMSSVAHEGTLKPTPDSMTEGPNYHSHGREREQVCVCAIERVHRRRTEESERVLVHVCDANMTGSSVTNGLLKCSP